MPDPRREITISVRANESVWEAMFAAYSAGYALGAADAAPPWPEPPPNDLLRRAFNAWMLASRDA